MSQITDFFADFDLPKNIVGDISLLLLFVAFSLVFGFVFGRWKLLNILINVYITLALISVLPQDVLTLSPYTEVGVFVILLIVLTAIDKRLFDLHISNAGTDFFWRLFVMSLLVTGMIVSVILASLPRAVALDFISVTAYGYFASPLAIIFWMVTPLLSLLFINNRLK